MSLCVTCCCAPGVPQWTPHPIQVAHSCLHPCSGNTIGYSGALALAKIFCKCELLEKAELPFLSRDAGTVIASIRPIPVVLYRH